MMNDLANSFSNFAISHGVNTGWEMESDGTYRLPDPVDDESGDPEGEFYIEPPSRRAIGRRWVVFRGLVPGIYMTWPEAEEMVVGISYCSHKSYGTPGESWQQYERQRLRGFVQKLPYIPPGAPKFPPLPGIPPPASQTPRKRAPTHHADGRTPNRPPAALTPSRSAPAKVRPSSRETSSNAKGKHPSTPTSSTISTPSSLGSMRSLRDACPPWEAHSQAFVVFEGSPPGLYTNWQDMRAVTKDTLGAVYRGYTTFGGAAAAFDTAEKGGYLRNV